MVGVSLAIDYWVEKYYYFRLYKDPQTVAPALAFRAFSLLKFMPLLQALGSSILLLYNALEINPIDSTSNATQSSLHLQVLITSGVALGLGAIFLLYPISVLNPFDCCFKSTN
jgi:hypothetical protein